jgi:hypothetical protein
MEEQYAIISKKIALVIGLMACLIFFTVLFISLKKTEECGTQPLYCGNSSSIINVNSDTYKGKTLFINNCAQCHNKNMKDPLTGPPLHNWREYFKDETEMWIFLKDNKAYLKTTKNKKLKQLHQGYQGIHCLNFPNLTLLDVQNITLYIRGD